MKWLTYLILFYVSGCQCFSKVSDGNSLVVPSNDKLYEYMLHLKWEDSYSQVEFHWNNIVQSGEDDLLDCMLLHRVRKGIDPPTWLGFGFHPFDRDGDVDAVDGSNLMIGSESIIGQLASTEFKGVQKYYLNQKYEGSPNGVQPMPDQYQTLEMSPRASKISQEVVQTNEGEFIETILSFKRLLNETEEIPIHFDSPNIFLYAIGGPSAPPQLSNSKVQMLGPHFDQGSFSLNFFRARNEIYDIYEMGTRAGCVSDDSEFDYLVVYPEYKLKIYWSLQLRKANVTEDDDGESMVKMRMSHLGEGWLGLGLSKDSSGSMIGSEVVIGRPALSNADGEKPLKYELRSKYVAGIMPMLERRQTLMDSSITQSGNEMILTFTKYLEEENEIPIQASGNTTFVFAIGYSDLLSVHKYSSSFQIDLSRCPYHEDDHETFPEKDIGHGTHETHFASQSIWVFHGVMGFIAFGLAMPIAIISVWLRKLLPTNWIYIHVYGNLISFTSTIIAFIAAVVTKNRENESHFTESHHIIGLILLLSVSLQIWFGLFRPAREVGEPNSNAIVSWRDWSNLTARVRWFLLHRFFGILLLSLGIYQVWFGLGMYAEDFVGTTDKSILFAVFVMVGSMGVGGMKIWSIHRDKQLELVALTASQDELALTPQDLSSTRGESPSSSGSGDSPMHSFVDAGLT